MSIRWGVSWQIRDIEVEYIHAGHIDNLFSDSSSSLKIMYAFQL